MPNTKKRTNEIKLCQTCNEFRECVITCEKHHYCQKCLYNLYSYLRSEYACVSCVSNQTKWRK